MNKKKALILLIQLKFLSLFKSSNVPLYTKGVQRMNIILDKRLMKLKEISLFS